MDIFLQQMLDNLPDNNLPPNWRSFDFESFSREKSLWDYQQKALEYALKALWKYYGESGLEARERKQKYYQWYRDFGLEINVDIPLDKSSATKRRLAALQETYYNAVDEKLPYAQFINSICFWMATGSGKTLVIVKLVEILHELINREEIPNHDILILAHRDDLLEQLRDHIADYNTTGGLYIRLHELKDYSEIKRAQPNLFSRSERTIFYYRSDNLSDEQKEKIIDFRNYDNHGRWYILLDEAHKGDREDSKRQQIYAIMSRNGFLFNFSATFTDPREIITTAFNFNLSEYIKSGYGKHIYIFDQETTAFKKKKDFTVSEKQKIILKALILLTYIKQTGEKLNIVNPELYHHPLMMVLVNSVNTKDADLKLFFRELVRIANGGIIDSQWQAAKDELIEEIVFQHAYLYEQSIKLNLIDEGINDLTQKDLLKAVFNSGTSGQIEVLYRPSDRKEIAFKMKTSDEAFALIRIGDVSEWLSKELKGYEINHSFKDESFFERLNQSTSSINLLLGSRSFYEGWDSNRPNVIMYINIGTGTDAKKFILQSVGRGARIEPLPGYRKRFRNLNASGVLSDDEQTIFQQIKKDIRPIESEFIFGTNKEALKTVIGELEQEDDQADSHEISLKLNTEEIKDHLLLIPVFRKQEERLYSQRPMAKFSLSETNLYQLKRYLDYLEDDRLLLAMYGASPKQIARIRVSINDDGAHYKTEGPDYKNLSVLLNQIIQYISLHAREFEKFKPLDDEINHYQHVRVSLSDVKFVEFEKSLEEFYKQPQKEKELRAKFEDRKIEFDEFIQKAKQISQGESFPYNGNELDLKRIQQHYYLPMLVSESGKLEYISRIIEVESEVKFLQKLEKNLAEDNNPFDSVDWWLFSRIDETRDLINIPYYYPFQNRIANFRPDFIFWIQKGNDYHIIFVDPKGTSRTEYQHKVDGFRDLFEKDGEPIAFEYGDMRVQVHLFLFTDDRAWPADYYRRYWLDNPQDIVNRII